MPPSNRTWKEVTMEQIMTNLIIAMAALLFTTGFCGVFLGWLFHSTLKKVKVRNDYRYRRK